MLRACEPLAFYRILFRHQHRQPIAKMDIPRGEPMVIGEGMSDHSDSVILERGEEPFWMADPGNGMHLRLTKIR